MQSSQEYILDRCQPIPQTGCWVWLLSSGSSGYGNAYWYGKAIGAHRLSYQTFIGSIPEGMLVRHSCDTLTCVNPDHLSLGADKTKAMQRWRARGREGKRTA